MNKNQKLTSIIMAGFMGAIIPSSTKSDLYDKVRTEIQNKEMFFKKHSVVMDINGNISYFRIYEFEGKIFVEQFNAYRGIGVDEKVVFFGLPQIPSKYFYDDKFYRGNND